MVCDSALLFQPFYYGMLQLERTSVVILFLYWVLCLRWNVSLLSGVQLLNNLFGELIFQSFRWLPPSQIFKFSNLGSRGLSLVLWAWRVLRFAAFIAGRETGLICPVDLFKLAIGYLSRIFELLTPFTGWCDSSYSYGGCLTLELRYG